MNKIISKILTATLLLVSENISAQTLSVKPIEVQTGEQTEMVINFTGGTSMTALQFNLQLPEGVTAAKGNATLGDATNGHTLSIKTLNSGDLLFVLYSLDQAAFADGELLRLPLTAGNKVLTDNGRLYSVRAATVDAVSHTCADASFTVTVNDGTSITSPLLHEEKTFIYDLQGRRTEHFERGFYIMNGKKVLIY